jgi:transposase
MNVCCRSEVKMVQNNGDFIAEDCQAKKKKYRGMSVTLGDKIPSFCTVKNWVAGFRTRHLKTEDEERSGRPTKKNSVA